MRTRSAARKGSYEVDVSEAIETWGDTVMRLAHRYLRNTPDAEDVFQTVFMRLFKSRDRISGEEHLKAWLIRVTLNCCYDELRKRRPNAALEEADTVEEAWPEAAPETALERRIDALSPSLRIAIHLFYFEGYSTDEIASMTGEKPATVRSHLYRARQALKISLGGLRHE